MCKMLVYHADQQFYSKEQSTTLSSQNILGFEVTTSHRIEQGQVILQ